MAGGEALLPEDDDLRAVGGVDNGRLGPVPDFAVSTAMHVRGKSLQARVRPLPPLSRRDLDRPG